MKFSKRCNSFRVLQVSILSMTMLAVQSASSQSMGISSTAITPDASSILEMRTSTKGLLIPRMTTTERGNIGIPATGLIVYNTSTNKFNFYNGSSWIEIVSGSAAVTSVTGTANRISISGTASDPIVDISSGYVGQSSITTLGTIATGTWNGSIIASTYGGTGNGFTKFSGATSSEKTYTLPDASTTILTKNYTGGLATGILKNTISTGELTIAVAGDFPTLNQNTTGSAATLTTSRNIYGNAFNGSADVTGIIVGTYGGTGVNNGSNTITLGGDLVTSGAFTTTLTSTATTNATLPTGTNTLYSTKTGSITSAQLLASLTDATGTGVAVFGSTPTLATPVINGLPTGTGVASAATASTLVARDANANTFVNNVNRGYATTATAAGTTTLTVSSAYFQFFTGSTTQTVLLPVTSTLVLGQQFSIINNSTGVVTVQSSGANTIQAMAAGSSIAVSCILTSGTGTASWSWDYKAAAASSNTANTLVIRDASGNFSAGTITAALTGNASTSTTLANSRNIYGNAFNGSADLGQVIASTYGGTGNGFTKFSGATSSEKTYTLPDASTTILTKDYTGGLATGILKSTTSTGDLSIAVAGDFPTLNQNTTGSAATLTTSHNIYGNAFNGSSDLSQIIASTYGGTGNGFTKFSGAATSEKTYTLPNANATILTDNTAVTAAQGGTGITSYSVGDLLYASGATTLSKLGAGTAGQVLKSNGAAAPIWENGVTIITLGSDVVNNNSVANTLADVTGLSFSVVAGVTYRFKALIIYNAAATGTGSRWTINGPASPTLLAYSSQYSLTATTNTAINANAYSLPAAANANSTYTTGNIAIIEGIVNPSANGTLTVRFASEVASSAITAKAGSTLHWW